MQRVPADDITPKLKNVHFPFYYASIQCLWVFWEVPIEAAEAALADAADFDTGLEVTRLNASCGGETAAAVINFQRYTGHETFGLTTCNEVEFNILCTPKNAPLTTALSLGQYMHGADQTATIGQLRLHVPADNLFAVMAGRDGFGEHKFYTMFDYNAPSLNDGALVADPPSYPNDWRTTLYRPDQFHQITLGKVDAFEMTAMAVKDDEKSKYLYELTADLSGMPMVPATCTPLTEFALGLGRTVCTRWTQLGPFQSRVFRGDEAGKVALKIGPEQPSGQPYFAEMRNNLERLIGDRPAYGAQTRVTPPGCIEPAGFFLDGKA
jgi:hypothetical protein